MNPTLLILLIASVATLGCLIALILWAVIDHRNRSKEVPRSQRLPKRHSATPSTQ